MNTRHIIALGAALIFAAGTVYSQSGPPAPEGGGGSETNTVDPAVIEAQRQAAYTNRFQQWVMGSESMQVVQGFATNSGFKLYSISTNMAAIYMTNGAAVTNFVTTNEVGLSSPLKNGSFSMPR